MRSLRGTLMVLGAALGAVGLAGLMESGCGEDKSATPVQLGPDATADHELKGDSAAGGEGDGGGGFDAVDGRGDVSADGAPVGLVVAVDEATAICTRLLSCCPEGLDGGTYDLQRCIDTTASFGWEETLPRDTRVYTRGHISVDQAKAARCVTALGSLPCGMQTPAQWGAVTSACELIVQGTIPRGSSGCVSSFECAPGNYCDPTVDGGVCAPLATQGQPCNTKVNDPTLGDNPLADEMCSYLSSGQPALFCDLIDNAPDAATCQPLLANRARCSNSTNGYYDDQACAPPALCGDNSQCGGTATYPYAIFCQSYRVQDAGGPG